MKIITLLADSGGTKTDWLAVDEYQQTHRFTTLSYHLVQHNQRFLDEQKKYWKQFNLTSCKLTFYGAGCLRQENKQKTLFVLEQLGFRSPQVCSDLELATKAVDCSPSTIAICGSGSVVFDYDRGEINTIRGGFGWEKGDEGSGFFFGKLLLQKLIENTHNYCLDEILDSMQKIRPLHAWIELQNTKDSKYEFAKLSSLLSAYKNHVFIAKVHRENINLFFQRHDLQNQKMYFVGSYAFYHQDFFCSEATKYGLIIEDFIQRPLEKIGTIE